MTHVPGMQSPLSRRSVLQGVAYAATVGTTLAGLANQAAAAKLSQKAVAYQEGPKGSHSCANCNLFQAPSSCKSVDGAISPNGWCNIWVQKKG